MPSPSRAKHLHFITVRLGETERILCAIATFRTAYRVALFENRIANPNLAERQAQFKLNREGEVWLWDRDRFEYEEEARWSPIGDMVKIQKVPVLKSR
jgi:hypothetical protein